MLAQFVQLEYPPGHVVGQHGRVHLMLRGKRSGLQRPGRIRPAAEGLALAGQRRRGQVTQVGVEPVVTEFGRGVRVPFRPVVQVLPGQSGELLVTAAVHIASGSPITGRVLGFHRRARPRCRATPPGAGAACRPNLSRLAVHLAANVQAGARPAGRQ